MSPRLVAGVVPVTATGQIVIISSRYRPGKWVLPKGGVEKGEEYHESALREAWEEAGIRGRATGECLGSVMEPVKVNKHGEPKTEFIFYTMQVEMIEEHWPEEHERTRRMVTPSEAMEIFANQPEFLFALNQWHATLTTTEST